MPFDLPRTLTLPSGLRVTLRLVRDLDKKAAPVPIPASDEEIFADAIALFTRGDVTIEGVAASSTATKKKIDVLDLALSDFHVIRAVLTKAGLLDEDEVELDCHNCGELIVIEAPCAGLETAPWEDDEAHDPELDALAPIEKPLDLMHPIALGRVRQARTVTFSSRTVRDARPIFKALAKDPVVIDAAFVSAMGIHAIGTETDPKRLARALEACGEASFDEIADAFLAVHYQLRLARDVFCSKCKARNTIDAPSAREFAPEPHEHLSPQDSPRPMDQNKFTPLPKLDEFVEKAHAIADPLIQDIPGDRVELIVESGTPDVDDGGEPLLGSYLPPPPKDAPVPMTPPLVTVYYRTFAAIEREEGLFDWEEELRETIEHELEHHIYFLRGGGGGGDDPMDDEERREIAHEVVRVVGESEVARRSLVVFGLSIPDFFRRAWPLVAIAAAVLVISLAEGHCSANDHAIEPDDPTH